MAGLPISGWLFAACEAVPFLGAALSFLTAGVLTQLIRTPMKVATGAKGFSWSATIEGFRVIFRQPVLRLIMLWVIGTNMVFNPSSIFLAILATARSRAPLSR